jgi:hypothetical protein
MSQAIVRWMRRVLPLGEIVVVGIGLDVALEIFYLVFRWWNGFVDENAFRQLRFFWLLFCAAFYGMFRVAQFHPLGDAGYREWLRLSPWTPDKPLPGGPLQLVPQDVVVIGILCLLYRTQSLMVLYFPTAFLFSYELTLAIFSRITGHWKLAYLIGFILGGVVFVGDRPELAFAVANAGVVVARMTVKYALQSFPWDLPWQAEQTSFKAISDEYKKQKLGWPYDQLLPKAPALMIPLRDGLCLSFLIGWWWIAILEHSTPQACAALAGGFGFQSLFPCFFRIAYYANSRRSPINIFGRILTLRWIIPGYDKILVAPALAFVVGSAFQGLACKMFLPQFGGIAVNSPIGILVSAGGVCAYLLIMLNLGPGLEAWRMTGNHRIVFDLGASGSPKRDEFIEL